LSTTVDISERAVREIAKVAPEKRQEVFQKATEAASGHVPIAREITGFESGHKKTVEPDGLTGCIFRLRGRDMGRVLLAFQRLDLGATF
jgi:hypothetical protein